MEPVDENKKELNEAIETKAEDEAKKAEVVEVEVKKAEAAEVVETEAEVAETEAETVEADTKATETEVEASAAEANSEETATTEAEAEAVETATTEAEAEAVETETKIADEATGDETKTAENAVEEDPDQVSDKKDELIKKIKIAIVAAGGVFILLAAVYVAAIMGGKNKAIDEEKETVVVVIPTEVPEEVKPTVIPTVEVVEEEMPEESLIGVVQGNARYDECIYADGGVVIVRKADKYGAIDYEGKEIVAVKYAEIEQLPTSEGMFALSVSKTESVTEEKDGTTYSYEDTTTTYSLFDNTGKELYKGNNKIVASGDSYILSVEDDEDSRKNRIEYYKFAKADKPYLTLYVNDQASMNGFVDGQTVVMGFSAVPTEDQDSNPTNLNCGLMDEKGKIKWFAKAPGIDKFKAQVKEWKQANKEIQKSLKTSKKDNKSDSQSEKTEELSFEKYQAKVKELGYSVFLTDKGEKAFYDADGNEVTDEDTIKELDEKIKAKDEKLADDSDSADSEATEDTEESDETSDTEDADDSAESDEYSSNGPVFHMNEILNAPVGGFFVYKDMYDVEDSYSWYTDKGAWYADLDVAYLAADAKKGFKVGNFNNGAVVAKGYVYDGEVYYNYGSMMVLHVGDKDVLIDISKAQGMTSDTVDDKIVVAVYDEIDMDMSANYWMYKDANKAGYIDLKGQDVKVVYDDATSFVDGYAFVVKNGKGSIIDETFAEVEEIGDAKSVELSGDVVSITSDTGIRRYMLKETRSNPTGIVADEEETADSVSDKDAKATPTVDAKATAEVTASAKNKKKK